jgi:hypothetical protein
MSHVLCRACETAGWCMEFGCIPLTPAEPQTAVQPQEIVMYEPTCWEVIGGLIDRWRNVGAWLIVALFTGIVLWNQRMVLWDWLDTPLWPIFAAGLAP